MSSIWEAIVRQFEQHRNFVLATILSVQGSSPRKVGAKVLILDNGDVVGTIGGGLFEANVRDSALNAMKSRTSSRLSFAFHGQDAGSDQMICGGSVEVLVEFVHPGAKTKEQIYRKLANSIHERVSTLLIKPIQLEQGQTTKAELDYMCIDENGARLGDFENSTVCLKSIPPRRLLKPAQIIFPWDPSSPVLLEWIYPRSMVYVLGAGHVGACVCHLASYVDFMVVGIDDRYEYANVQNLPDADEIVVAPFENAFEKLCVDRNSFIVIVTRGHAHDKIALAQALKTDATYIGMIGSKRKIKLIYDSLIDEGFTESDIARVHAPIGLPIGGETPQEIAVSIVAEMVQERIKILNIQV
ncbi:MAG: XdhC family aldehyde oxidoreductase maturation factor [Desulfomonilaceae bacterium]